MTPNQDALIEWLHKNVKKSHQNSRTDLYDNGRLSAFKETWEYARKHFAQPSSPEPVEVEIKNDRVRIAGKWFYASAEPLGDVVENLLYAGKRVYKKYGADSDWTEWRDFSEALAAMDTARGETSEISVVEAIEKHVYHEAQDSEWDSGFNEAKRQAVAVAKRHIKPVLSKDSAAPLESGSINAPQNGESIGCDESDRDAVRSGKPNDSPLYPRVDVYSLQEAWGKDGKPISFDRLKWIVAEYLKYERKSKRESKPLDRRILIGGNHLASSLLSQCDPLLFHNYDEALEARGITYADMWCAWRAILDVRDEMNPTDIEEGK